MPSRRVWIAGLAAMALWSPALRAQIPGAAGAAGSALGGAGGAAGGLPAAAGAGAAAAPAAQPTTLCSLIGLGPALEKCKAKLCASQFGQMLNNMTGGPLGALSGGFIPPLCPPPTAAQAAALAAAKPGSAAAAAAAIQASEADAAARVAAIEYLATVDCSRWPEAQKALIKGLREDPNECVRFAAARGLNSGCCCDKKVIDALRLSVSGETTDGAPAENSPRVKAAAFSALQNCLLRVPEDLPPESVPVDPERTSPNLNPLPGAGPERTTQHVGENPHIAAGYTAADARRRPSAFDEQLQHKTFSQTVEEARRTLFDVARSPRPPAAMPTGRRSLFGALAKARQDMSAANVRRAQEQGQLPPMPAMPATDPGFQPSSYVPVPSAAPGTSYIEPAPEAGSEARGSVSMSLSDEAPAPAARPNSAARRGLVGMLLQPRDR